MSTRAIRADIAERGLDPTVPHKKVDKSGRLVDANVALRNAPPAKTPEKEVRNALVEMTSSQDTSDDRGQEAAVETDADQPKKNNRFKKKTVSTDP